MLLRLQRNVQPLSTTCFAVCLSQVTGTVVFCTALLARRLIKGALLSVVAHFCTAQPVSAVVTS